VNEPADGSAEPEGERESPLFRDRIDQCEIDLYDEILAGLGCRPAFNLIMALDCRDETIRRARRTLRSLMRQAYADWHLFVVSRYRHIGHDEIVDRLVAGRDDLRALRAGVLRHDGDGGAALRARLLAGWDDLSERVSIERRSARCLGELGRFRAAPGRPIFTAAIGAGDELSGDCLAELAIDAAMHPEADLLYSDEECINCATQQRAPFLKPDWSPDLLLSTNYIGRLWCARDELLARAQITFDEWLRFGEYHLVLRGTERARAIRHTASVLCRRSGGRLDSAASERRALAGALARRGIDGEIRAGCAPGIYRLMRHSPQERRVSIIIPTYGAAGLIRRCLTTLRRKTRYRNFEIICIDQMPPSDTANNTWLCANADKVVEMDEGLSWSRCNNAAARQASGEFLVFLSEDSEVVEADWLHALIEHAQRPEVGAVGPQLLDPGGTVRSAGMFLVDGAAARHAFRRKGSSEIGYFGLALTQRNVTAVAGACLVTRRELFERMGGFDEAPDIIDSDLDYCLRLRGADLLCVFTPYSALIQREDAGRNPQPDHIERAAFASRRGGNFSAIDAYRHDRLSRDADDYAVEQEYAETLCIGAPMFDARSIRKILVVKLDHIGDSVGAVPAVRRLKRAFPQAALCVLAGSWTTALWAMIGEIDEMIPFDLFSAQSDVAPRELTQSERRVLQERLEAYAFDIAIDLRLHPESRPLLRHAGARYTAGFDHQSRFPWLDIALQWDADRRETAKRQYFGDALINLVDAVAAAGERDRRGVLRGAGRQQPRLSATLLQDIFARRVVCVHPAVGNETRRWPAGHFARLIDRLIETADVNIAIIGTAGDRDVVAQVLQQVQRHDRVFNLIGAFGLDDLANFLSACALFVGNNSGPKHIAAALGVPTVGVHSGVVDSREWGPVGPRAVAVRRRMTCSPCYLPTPAACDRGLACLTELRPADVLPACERLLAIGYGGAFWTMEGADRLA
jgi:lipopolysaccharide heptosyltransferase II